ncbi:MAG: hypothetical protein ACLPTZ_03630, partial [Beijerinckiaceae bacterium]
GMSASANTLAPPTSIYPTARNLTAGEDKGLRPFFVDDGEFKITVERCGRYGSPHEALCASGIDCHTACKALMSIGAGLALALLHRHRLADDAARQSSA